MDGMSDNLKREELSKISHFLSTGSILLDLAISDHYPGGVGGGRICHFYGGASTAKTVIAQEILGAAQRQGGSAIFEDAEYTLDFNRTKLFGLNIGEFSDERFDDVDGKLEDSVKSYGSDFVYRCPTTIEGFFDDEIGGAIKLLQEGKLKAPVAMAVDSLTALPSVTEKSEAMDKATYDMSRAKMFSKGFRKYIGDMAKLGLTVVLIDQTRENVGVVFGKKHTTSGGKAKEFYASTRVLLTHKGKILNQHKRVIGVVVGFVVEKNKLAAPFRAGEFDLLFDYGIDDLSSNLNWIKEQNIESFLKCSSNGRWVWEEKGFKGIKADLIQMIEERELWKEVELEVVRIWNILYEPTGRRLRYD